MFGCILHPTDFTRSSFEAFQHALKLALCARSELRLLHVKTAGEHTEWRDFPGVREQLIGWGLLPPDASRQDVLELGLRPVKWVLEGRDTVGNILDEVERHQVDLLVLATHGRSGLARFLSREVARPVLRQAAVPTLLFPPGSPGFVCPDSGRVRLRRVLIPVCTEPGPSRSVTAAQELVHCLGAEPVSFRLLYVGRPEDMPAVRHPDDWEESVRLQGPPAAGILEEVRDWQADLVVMATRGHDSLTDSLFGSTVDHVLEKAACPVLALPFRTS